MVLLLIYTFYIFPDAPQDVTNISTVLKSYPGRLDQLLVSWDPGAEYAGECESKIQIETNVTYASRSGVPIEDRWVFKKKKVQ